MMRSLLLSALLIMAACRGGERPARNLPTKAVPDPVPLPTGGKPAKDATPDLPDGGPPTAPPVVIFVVIDTMRADHTSLCGYERPTTSTLKEMVKRGAAVSCRTYSPAPWTHPSHASFFTGVSVVEHNAIFVTDSSVAINPVTRVRPLDPKFETVAERFKAAGYQTIALSANMIIQPPSGLLQGFDTVVAAKASYELRGAKFNRALEGVLAQADPTRPLFLFMNFYDAHDPYPVIPDGVDWAPPQPLTDLHPNQKDPEHPYFRFVKGLLRGEEQARFLRHVVNGYDWGLHQADAGLGAAMQLLIDREVLAKGFRVVVTSDHGEFLGEHQLLRHGGFLYEPVVRVPMLYYDSTAKKQVDLPEIASGLWVHDLLLYGRLPPPGSPVHAISEPNDQDTLVGALGAAVWDGHDKIMCANGQRSRFDLLTDPEEKLRMPLNAHPLVPQLRDLCERADTMAKLPPPTNDDPGVMEMLKAAGYVSPD